MRLDASRQHYIGLTWADNPSEDSGKTPKAEAVLRMKAGDYRDFLDVLERLTGKKPVDTGKSPAVVRYRL
jgi:hypothetical protein